eukprot:COSAG02_NODE_2440_length_8858_cov_73.811965_3_plen_166_part_00
MPRLVCGGAHMALSLAVLIIAHATLTLAFLSGAQAASVGSVGDEVTYGSSYVMDDQPQEDSAASGSELEKPPVPPGAQRISFKPPQMDEEESESTSLPDAYRCDACAAIAYQIEAQCVCDCCACHCTQRSSSTTIVPPCFDFVGTELSRRHGGLSQTSSSPPEHS